MNSNESTSVQVCSCNFTNMEKSYLLCHMSGFIFRFTVFFDSKSKTDNGVYLLIVNDDEYKYPNNHLKSS